MVLKPSKLVIQAEAYFSLMYRRYLKQMVGWKRAMEVQLNQRCLIEKLQKVDFLYSESVGSGTLYLIIVASLHSNLELL